MVLAQPMLAVAVDSHALPAGYAAEPKWDGYRTQLAVYKGGRVLLRSRYGTEMTGSFPDHCPSPACRTHPSPWTP
nr:hypothetical protein [Streptomyces glaucescens]